MKTRHKKHCRRNRGEVLVSQSKLWKNYSFARNPKDVRNVYIFANSLNSICKGRLSSRLVSTGGSGSVLFNNDVSVCNTATHRPSNIRSGLIPLKISWNYWKKRLYKRFLSRYTSNQGLLRYIESPFFGFILPFTALKKHFYRIFNRNYRRTLARKRWRRLGMLTRAFRARLKRSNFSLVTRKLHVRGYAMRKKNYLLNKERDRFYYGRKKIKRRKAFGYQVYRPNAVIVEGKRRAAHWPRRSSWASRSRRSNASRYVHYNIYTKFWRYHSRFSKEGVRDILFNKNLNFQLHFNRNRSIAHGYKR